MKQEDSKIMEASQSTMTYDLLAFGIARDIVGGSMVKVTVPGSQTVGQLKVALREKYPDFERLKSLAIAVNEEYREDDYVLKAKDEIVIIPPVSGGQVFEECRVEGLEFRGGVAIHAANSLILEIQLNRGQAEETVETVQMEVPDDSG